MYLLLLFLLLPVLEIATFIQVGEWIGLWPTVMLVILSAMLGVGLIRTQGFVTLLKARQSMERGEPPVGALFDGMCMVMAGVLLIVPGFITDAFALLLLLPFVRGAMGRWIVGQAMRGSTVRVYTDGRPMDGRPGEPHRHRPPPGVIDGDFREVDPRPGADAGADARGDIPSLADSRWAPPGSKQRDGRD